MIQGFSTNSPLHHAHLAFDDALPMPFKIPIVLQTLLDPQTDLAFTPKQEDLLSALRLSYEGRKRLFESLMHKEQALVHEMTQENANTALLKEEYEEIQSNKMEASEMFFDILNALAEDLEPQQYQKLMELCNIQL